MVVWLGLWIEKEADEEEKKEHFSNLIGDAKIIKLKANFGWWILMAGILIEILTGAGLAVYDVRENIKTKAEIATNSPLNQQVSDVSVNAILNVKGPYVPYLGQEMSTWVTLTEQNRINSGVPNTLYLGGFNILYSETIQAGERHKEIGNDYKIYFRFCFDQSADLARPKMDL